MDRLLGNVKSALGESVVEEETEENVKKAVVEVKPAIDFTELEVAMPKDESEYTIIPPDKGSYFDIVDAKGETILHKKLNGKAQVIHFLQENPKIRVSNKEVLL